MNLINIENLTKVYTERKLFDGASFSLQDGEKVGIIGVNGTGKTTLLRMIMGKRRQTREPSRRLTMWSCVICRSIRNSNRKKQSGMCAGRKCNG